MEKGMTEYTPMEIMMIKRMREIEFLLHKNSKEISHEWDKILEEKNFPVRLPETLYAEAKALETELFHLRNCRDGIDQPWYIIYSFHCKRCGEQRTTTKIEYRKSHNHKCTMLPWPWHCPICKKTDQTHHTVVEPWDDKPSVLHDRAHIRIDLADLPKETS